MLEGEIGYKHDVNDNRVTSNKQRVTSNFYPACPVGSNDRIGVKCFTLFNWGNKLIKYN